MSYRNVVYNGRNRSVNLFTWDTDGVVALTNDDVPTKTLPKDALIITDASTTMKVRHPDHHMYATSNNVTISGVKSAASADAEPPDDPPGTVSLATGFITFPK